MPVTRIIEPDDLYSRIYADNVAEIVRDNDDLIDRAIDAAIAEAKMYLSRYDLPALFGTATASPTFPDFMLKNICVDIAIWRLVLLGNPGIDYQTAKECYESAARSLRDIQSLKANPDGWPYRDTTGQTAPKGSTVNASYNRKRDNDF